MNASRRAFTLFEILAVAVIISVLAGILIVAVARASNGPKAAKFLQLSKTYAAFLRDAAANNPTFRGQLPVTRSGGGATIPTAGQLALASVAAKETGASFDLVMLAERMIERLDEINYGGPNRPAIGVQWDTTNRTFVANPDTPAAVAAIPAAVTWQRIESRLSDPTLSPDTAQGANFQFTPGVNLPAQVVVVYWWLPQAPQALAEELVRKANKPEHQPASGAAATIGPVAYAAPVGGFTDIFLYVTQL